MSDLAGVLVTAFFLTATVAAGVGFWWSLWPLEDQQPETLTDHWRKLSDEVPR